MDDVQSIVTMDMTEASVAFTVSINPLTHSFHQLRVVLLLFWFIHHALLSCSDSLAPSEIRTPMSVPLAYARSEQRTQKAPHDVNMADQLRARWTFSVYIHTHYWLLADILSSRLSLTAVSSQSL